MTDDFIEEELNILNHFGVDQDEGEIHILPALPSLTRYVSTKNDHFTITQQEASGQLRLP